jgi:hypothetical protein
MTRLRSWFAALLTLALLAGSGQAQLLNTVFPEAPRPTRPELPAAGVRPVLPAAPVMPQMGVTFDGLVNGSGTSLHNRNDPSYQILMRRLTLEVQEAQYAFQAASQGRDQRAIQAAYQRLLIAQRRLQIAQTNPSMLFFPMFGASGGLIDPGQQPIGPGQPVPDLGEGDAGALPGDTRRIIFKRNYPRFNWMGAGTLEVHTGQASRSEMEGVINKANIPSWVSRALTAVAADSVTDFYNFTESVDEENPKAQWMKSTRIRDPADPTRMRNGWLFRKIQGDPKRRSFEDHLTLIGRDSDMYAFNAAGVPFARIRHETWTSGGEQVTGRVYYLIGATQPVAVLTEGTFGGLLPALILKSGRDADGEGEGGGEAPQSEVLFYMVFTGWKPAASAHPADAGLRLGIGRFLDAWIMSEPWRGTVGIAHNFGFGDD